MGKARVSSDNLTVVFGRVKLEALRSKLIVIVDFRLLFKARFPSLLSTCQLRFQIWKLGGNFATKFASSFQSSNLDCKQM
jgi:hypothetical protein